MPNPRTTGRSLAEQATTWLLLTERTTAREPWLNKATPQPLRDELSLPGDGEQA